MNQRQSLPVAETTNFLSYSQWPFCTTAFQEREGGKEGVKEEEGRKEGGREGEREGEERRGRERERKTFFFRLQCAKLQDINDDFFSICQMFYFPASLATRVAAWPSSGK